MPKRSDLPADDAAERALLVEAGGGIVSALTFLFAGNTPAAEQELARLKRDYCQATIDFMFGSLAEFIQQIALNEELLPAQIVRGLGTNIARMASGLEDWEP